jgi:hypothetical protein
MDRKKRRKAERDENFAISFSSANGENDKRLHSIFEIRSLTLPSPRGGEGKPVEMKMKFPPS